MLVKIGDMWIDPMEVEAIQDGEEITEVVEHKEPTVHEWSVITHSTRDVWRVDPANPCATLWTKSDGCEYVARGITGDDAAQIVNRCREADRGPR